MSDTMTTIVGNLVASPVLSKVGNGRSVARMRVACTETAFNPETRSYVDVRTSYYNVSAWGPLAENAAFSFEKGHRVVVHGKLFVDTYQNRDGEPRTSVQIDARALGHDLMFGETRYRRVVRSTGEAGPAEAADAARRSDDHASHRSDDHLAGPVGAEPDAEACAVVDQGGGVDRPQDEDAEPIGDYVEIDGIFVDPDGVIVG